MQSNSLSIRRDSGNIWHLPFVYEGEVIIFHNPLCYNFQKIGFPKNNIDYTLAVPYFDFDDFYKNYFYNVNKYKELKFLYMDRHCKITVLCEILDGFLSLQIFKEIGIKNIRCKINKLLI